MTTTRVSGMIGAPASDNAPRVRLREKASTMTTTAGAARRPRRHEVR